MSSTSASRYLAHLILGMGLAVAPAALVGPAAAQEDGSACGGQQIRLDAGCTPLAEAADGVRRIVERAIEQNDLNSVIVRISVDGRPLITEAWGESMTGVPATPDMHFRNGAIAIPYLTTVLLKLANRVSSRSTTSSRSGFRIIRSPTGSR